jgi:hypothetical protein
VSCNKEMMVIILVDIVVKVIMTHCTRRMKKRIIALWSLRGRRMAIGRDGFICRF